MVNLMKLNVEPLEAIVLILFILYLIFNVETPRVLAPYINDPVGMVVIVVGVLYLLYYCHPILGILGIFVAYELMRRSCPHKIKHVRFNENTESKKKQHMKKMNPPKETTLEESVVAKMAPVRKQAAYMMTSFKPVNEDVHNAMKIN